MDCRSWCETEKVAVGHGNITTTSGYLACAPRQLKRAAPRSGSVSSMKTRPVNPSPGVHSGVLSPVDAPRARWDAGSAQITIAEAAVRRTPQPGCTG
jgi:hypothetical protein